METFRLADLRPGECGIVTAISSCGTVTARLMELGLVPGATVEVLRKAPFGDPVQYRIRGSVISMRASEAAFVTVRTADSFSESSESMASVRSRSMALVAG